MQKKSCFVGGFTLIELLVVVLIIGILAAIALPQYQKAVARSRASEVLVNANALEKMMDLYVLEHGLSEQRVDFLGTGKVDTDIELGLTPYEGTAESESFEYTAYCQKDISMYGDDKGGCCWSALSWTNGYALEGDRTETGSHWNHYCEYEEGNSVAAAVCQSFYDKGWLPGAAFF